MPKVAAIQMVSTPDVDANLSSAEILLEQAADQGAQLAVLPEFFPIMSDDHTEKILYQEEPGTGPLQNFLLEQARRHGFWLMGGTIPLRSDDPDRVYNSCLLFNPQGECTARYDKIHLFDVYIDSRGDESYNESATMVPGKDIVTAQTPFGKIGMTICYDLRFPELYRKLIDDDAVIFTVPSAFTESTGRRHWEMLLKTRAVENLSFVIAPNQGGQHTAKRTTWGHSMIIDPWGNILSSLETGPGVACADIDLDRVQELRESFPAIKHRVIR